MQIILFVRNNSWISNILLYSVASCLLSRGFRVSVVINGSRRNCLSYFFQNLYFLTYLLKYYNEVRNIDFKISSLLYPTCFLCMKLNVKYLYVSTKQFKGVEFENLIKDIKPDYGFSLGWPLKFHESFIRVFNFIVNYHNGLLPEYRGVYSTHWSIYNGDKLTGYSYNLISREIDAGPVLISRVFPVSLDRSVFSHELQKVNMASNDVEEIVDSYILGNGLDNIIINSENGAYYSYNDLIEITSIEDPRALEISEINKRAKIFGFVNILVDDGWLINVKVVKAATLTWSRKYVFKTGSGIYATVGALPIYILRSHLNFLKKFLKNFF